MVFSRKMQSTGSRPMALSLTRSVSRRLSGRASQSMTYPCLTPLTSCRTHRWGNSSRRRGRPRSIPSSRSSLCGIRVARNARSRCRRPMHAMSPGSYRCSTMPWFALPNHLAGRRIVSVSETSLGDRNTFLTGKELRAATCSSEPMALRLRTRLRRNSRAWVPCWLPVRRPHLAYASQVRVCRGFSVRHRPPASPDSYTGWSSNSDLGASAQCGARLVPVVCL